MNADQVKLAVGAGIIVGVISASAALGWWINGNRWESKVSKIERDHAVALQQSSERARELEHAWQINIEEVAKNARKEIDELESDLADADAAAGSLREELAKRTSAATSNTPSACRSTSATSALILYSELLDRGAERIAALAEEADRRRVAGLACEAAYEVLRGNKKAGG